VIIAAEKACTMNGNWNISNIILLFLSL